jgi:hypothetical protein
VSETQRQKEMRILAHYRNARGESKKSYFPVPKERVSFVAIATALLESSVWRSLGIYDRRFIDQILIVHARSGGVKNGYLTLTHLRLKAAGIKGDRIKPTVDNLVRLRLLDVTHQGGPADPSRYRVTFLPHIIQEVSGRIIHYPPGNEWIEIEIDSRVVAREKRHTPPHLKTDFQRSKYGPVPGAKYGPADKTGTITTTAQQPVEESSKCAISEPSRAHRYRAIGADPIGPH